MNAPSSSLTSLERQFRLPCRYTVTVTSAEVRNRIAATLEWEEEWLFEKPASAPDLGSLGRSKD